MVQGNQIAAFQSFWTVSEVRTAGSDKPFLEEKKRNGGWKMRILHNGAMMSIDPMGAQMLSYQDASKKNWLWSAKEGIWGSAAPILFPVIGSLKAGKVLIGGKPVFLPKHGFARKSLFSLQEEGVDFATFMLSDTQETRAVYPFCFGLKVTHRLLSDGFETLYHVENRGNEEMPFTLGGHPGFLCPMEEGEVFSDYEVRFEKPEKGQCLRVLSGGLLGDIEPFPMESDHQRISLTYGLFDERDTLVFPGILSRNVSLVHSKTGKGIRLHFPQSSCLAIWTMPNAHAPYLCLEPWNGLPAFERETGHFEDKPYHLRLQPQESFQAGYRMEILR